MNTRHWWNNNTVQYCLYGIIILTTIIMCVCIYNKGGIDFKKLISMFEPNPQKIEIIGPSPSKPPSKIIKSPPIIEENELVEFILNLQPRLDNDVAIIIATSIETNSEEFGFPPELIASLIYRESSFNIVAVSSAKCVGLMQINPTAHQDKINKLKLKYNDLCKINNNIKLGCMILKEYYIKHKGDIVKALTNYVGGNQQGYVLDILAEYTNSQINI